MRASITILTGICIICQRETRGQNSLPNSNRSLDDNPLLLYIKTCISLPTDLGIILVDPIKGFRTCDRPFN